MNNTKVTNTIYASCAISLSYDTPNYLKLEMAPFWEEAEVEKWLNIHGLIEMAKDASELQKVKFCPQTIFGLNLTS